MKIYVHAGTFHADDVFCVALFKALDHNATVVRTFKVTDDMFAEAAEGSAIIADIGGKYNPAKGLYDHHQADAPRRENGKKYAAFGQLVAQQADAFWFRAVDELAQQIDSTDNGEDEGPHCALSLAVAAMNPCWNEDSSPAAMDAAFMKAVAFAEQILRAIIHREESACEAEWLVMKSPEWDEVKVLPKYAPWQDYCAGNDFIKAIVWPSNRGGYNCQINPVAPGSFDRCGDFSGIKAGENGCTFIHTAGFLAAFDTEEAAIAAGKAVIRR